MAFLKGLGSIASDADSEDVIGRKAITLLDYPSLSDLAWLIPGAYVRELGSIGQPSQLTLRGLGWQQIAVLMDGRTMSDPLLGTVNLNFFPLESVQRLEYEASGKAFLQGLNSTGGVLNIFTPDYYTNRPYSKIRYSEGGYSFLSADGIFSQNLSRTVNLAASFQRRTLDGRFPNSNYEAWNARAKLRYLISEKANLLLSETYNGTELGLNGGVDLLNTSSGDVFDELRATVRNTDSFEKVRRHDLTGILGLRLLPDTLSVTTFTFYYSNNLREYRDEENRQNPNGILIQSDHRSSWYGIKFNQKLRKWGKNFSLGGEILRREVNESPNVGSLHETSFSLTGRSETTLSNLTAAVFGRYDRLRDENFASYGATLDLQVLPSLSAFSSYSISYRTPTIQELYWNGPGIARELPLEKAKNRLFEVGFSSDMGEVLHLRATYFNRRIDNSIVALPVDKGGIFPSVVVRNVPDEMLEGVDGKIQIMLWRFSAQAVYTYLNHHRNGIEKRIYPKVFANGEIAFRTELFQDHLDLQVGLRGKFFTEQYGEQFNPETMMYVENRTSTFGPSGSADLFLIGKVGNAILHFVLENITDQRYMLTPYFPMQNRKVRFGVAWEFLD